MRIATNGIKVLVGVLFIVSGLIKANDPLGLSYKMEEFFEVWNASLSAGHFFIKTPLINFISFLHGHSLGLSLFMIGLEIMTGIALLVGWRKRLVLSILLLLIIFFTFLTGYAYASGKFKNCGCFGDCLPITPFVSFLKDVLLLFFIIWLIINNRFLQPVATRSFRIATLIAFLFLSIGLQWYVLNYLPIKDCLPFKVGNNIQQQMKIPANAITDSFAIRFVYEKGGKQYEFSPSDLPADLQNYKFVNRTDKLIRKGNAEPPIKAFSLVTIDDEDSTQALLNDSGYSVWYYFNPTEESIRQWRNSREFVQRARQKNIPVYIITTEGDGTQKQIHNLPILKCDVTVFRTAARTNPCIYIMKGGTIIHKWSGKEVDDAEAAINKLSMQTATVPNLAKDSSNTQ